jgi:selenocysteine-specific elongation factor
VSLHVGSAETEATLSLLDVDQLEPGQSGWAQARLVDPVAVVKGDFFVVRTPNATMGGGEVIDAHPRRHKRFQAAVVEGLQVFQRGSPDEIIVKAMEGKPPCELDAVVQASELPKEQVRQALEELSVSGGVVRLNGYYTTAQDWQKLEQQVTSILKGYHKQYPLRIGMPREEVKSKTALSAKAFVEVAQRLAEQGNVVEMGSTMRLAEHAVRFNPELQRRLDTMFKTLSETPYSPPPVSELQQRYNFDDEVFNALLEQKRLIKVAEGIVFLPDAYERMVQRVVDLLKANGKVTVGEVRDMFGSSRKYVLALLERLDEQKVTRRVGDERVLRS